MKPTFNSIIETVLYIKDTEATKAFYHGQLGLEVISEDPGRFVFFRVGASMLLCFEPEQSRVQTNLPSHYAHGQQHFAFECDPDQFAAWKAILQNANIPIEHEQDWGNGIWSLYFRDPDQHCVEILMPGLWF